VGADAGLLVQHPGSEADGEVLGAVGLGQESARRIAQAFVRMERPGSAEGPQEAWRLDALAGTLWPSSGRGMVCTTLMVSRAPWAYLVLIWDVAEKMPRDVLERLRPIARQVTLTIEMALERDDLEQRVERLAGRIAQSFFRQTDLHEACSSALACIESREASSELASLARLLFGATYAALLGPGEEARFQIIAHVGESTDNDDWLAESEHILELAARDRTSIVLTGPAGSDRPDVVRIAIPVGAEEREPGEVLVLEHVCDQEVPPTEFQGQAVLEHLAEIRSEIGTMCRKAQSLHLDSIMALADAADAIDPYTRGETDEVRRLATELGTRLGLSPERLENLGYACMLRDLGMITISRAVLHQPGALSEEDWDWVRQHPGLGANTLDPIPYLAEVAPLVRWHHERYDGSGYPDGLAREAIPLENRIISVAEAFCAMTSERAHRPATTPAEALAEIRRLSGSQFDPAVVEHLAAIVL